MELLTPLKILKHDLGNPVTIAHLPMTFLFKFSSMKREDRRLGAQPGIFRVGEISWNRSTSIKVSCTTYKRKAPRGNILVFFKSAFKWEFNRTQTGHFFPKLGHKVCKIRALLLYFQKRQGRPLPLPSASFTPVQRPHKKIWESSESSNESTA